MPEIHFYLANKRDISPINLVFSHDGHRYRIPTKLSVPAEFWNADLQRVKDTKNFDDCTWMNRKLNTMRESITALLRDANENDRYYTVEELSSIVRAIIKPNAKNNKGTLFLSYAREYLKNKQVATNTKRRYNTTLNLVDRYQLEKNIQLGFFDINMSFYNSFQRWMYNQDLSVNYFGGAIKDIKVIHKSAKSDGLHKLVLPEEFVRVTEETDAVYLSNNELLSLHDLVINEDLVLDAINLKLIKPSLLKVKGNMERMIDSLVECRDSFLIGCYTAMRFCDYTDLNVISYRDEYVTRRSEKTGIMVVIPMHQVVREIMERRGDVLPNHVSNQKMNSQLKKLCMLAKISTLVEIVKSKGGKKFRKVYKKWQVVSTHTARRSFCTNAYLANMNLLDIATFSGHKTIKSLLKYIRATPIETAIKSKDSGFWRIER